MGYALCMSACYGCGRVFGYNPNLVPSITPPGGYVGAAQAASWVESAGQWRDFERHYMSPEERDARRAGDLAQAQVHATLAVADELDALRETISSELDTLGATVAGQYRG